MVENAGRNLRRIRRERDLTQTQLARLGKIKQQQLSAYENGLQMPLALIARLARILGVDPNELLGDPRPAQSMTDEKEAAFA